MDACESWRKEAEEFLAIAGQFSLGHLDTEQGHPLTEDLSIHANSDARRAVETLLEVEARALATLSPAELAEFEDLVAAIRTTLNAGGRIILTGCGATGRLALALEAFVRKGFFAGLEPGKVLGYMAGGDAALVRSIEGFEDRWEDGVRQMEEAGIHQQDLVVGITEGGETTWVLATVDWATRTTRRNPWLLFCNPARQLTERLERCRKVISNPCVRSWYLPTGPMAIAGSTRMQATTVQMTAVGMALAQAGNRDLPTDNRRNWVKDLVQRVRLLPKDWLTALATCEAKAFLGGQLLHYRVHGTGLTLLTDTTERSPTFSVLPFENERSEPQDPPAPVLLTFPDHPDSASAWHSILGRAVRCLEWSHCRAQTGWQRLQGFDLSARALARRQEIGSMDWLFFEETEGAWHLQFCGARHPGIPDFSGVRQLNSDRVTLTGKDAFMAHMLLKAFMNTLSTLSFTMAGRVESNLMIYVKAANLKLIDRALRTIRTLYFRRTGKEVSYELACHELFRLRGWLAPQESIVLRTLESLERR